ncbi:MAG: chaperone modulatory protein CbpM [Planctomycetota bacterium]|jgi:chaperone modulatory protein CbpM
MTIKVSNVTVSGVILDEHSEVTLDDLCRVCRVEQAIVLQLVEEGVLEPNARDVSPWRFSGTTVPLVAKALRLQRDLGLNLAGVAIALDLLDEIERLRKRIEFYESATGGLDD